jgi:HK97 family phage major capsid protein/HK97 family phage prohead protease
MKMASYKPTEGMVEEARKGLDWRSEFGRGGTEVGIARARDIVNGKNLSEDTVKRMFSFFSRHEVDKKAQGFRPGEEGYPSNGRIAWALWGGDAGFSWSRKIAGQIDNNRALTGPMKKALEKKVEDHNDSVRAANKKVNMRMLTAVFNRGIGAYKTNPESVRPNVSSPEQWALARCNSFLYAVKNEKFRSGKHDTDLFPDGHPLKSKGEKQEIVDMERHIINVEETEDSFIIEFGKGEMEVSEPEEMPEESEEERDEDYEAMAEAVAERFNADEIVYRSVELDRGHIDEEKRTVRIGVSSETPVEREFGLEVLSHKKEDIDMEFMSSGRAPLLNNHKMDEQIGVIRSYYLDESQRRTVAMVEFGKSALAQEVFEDVKAGIKQNVSVGYSINRMVRTKGEDGKEYYRASWTPMEASIVSVPADSSRLVGVGRSKTQPTNEVKTMTVEENSVDARQVGEEAKAEAFRSAAEIIALGKHHNQRDLADKAVERGVSVEQFRGELLEAIRNDKPLETPAVVDVAPSEQKEYSLLRAIKAASSGDWRDAGYEREISDEIAKRSGKEARGFYIPANINWGKRDQTAGTDSQGGFLVSTDHLADQFIEALYARLTITQLGARVMQGLKGDVSIPKLSASVTNSAFVAEGSAPSEGAATFAQVTMSPKTLAAYVDVTRKLMMQSDPSVEQLLRNDIVNTFARKIDEVAIEGGGSNEPTGIIGNSSTNVVAMGTNGAAVTYAKVVDLIKEVEVDNAIINDTAFLTNPKVIAALRTVSKQTSGVEGNFIMDPDGTVLGHQVASSTLVPSDLSKGTGSNLSALIYGDFSQVMLGFYSGVDVVVDQASLSTSGGTRLAFFQDMDIALRYPESFAVIKDIVAS